MTTEDTFLTAIRADPLALDTWLVLADWLEENGNDGRAELVRLHAQLRGTRQPRARRPLEKRTQELLGRGIRPPVARYTNSLGMQLVLVPPGVFFMGSPARRPPADDDEFPRRLVEITRPYLLGAYHVSQQQYEQVMSSNPSYFGPDGPGKALVHQLTPDKLPVDSVSYSDIIEFCSRLSALSAERQAGLVYRLPTEAEWEYACRACICHTGYHLGSSLLARDARFNSDHPIAMGSYLPNLFGLYDMHGNMWEWCQDWYDADYYRNGPARDPLGPQNGARRVLRGGAWSSPEELCRSALRGHNTVDARHNYNGFRVAVSLG